VEQVVREVREVREVRNVSEVRAGREALKVALLRRYLHG